jgi:CRP-like cAMP-binding protein
MDAASLRACPLFQTLSSEQVGRIAAIATRREAPGGTALFVEGSSGDEMYVLLTGKVRISKRLPGVGEEALAILEPGAYFGEMAMVDDSPRSADALAHTSCAVAVIKREELEQLMFIDKDLAYVLLWTFVRTLSVRLREMNEKIQGFFAMTGPFR